MGLFKSKTRSVVGLDIEPGFVAAAEFSHNGKPVLVRAATTSLGPGLFHEGEVVDVEALADRLRAFFRDNDLPKKVRLGVASQKMAVRVMELPAIDDAQELDAAIRFQAQEELPMPVEQAVLDHRLLERIEDGQGGRMRILVVAARRDSVEHLLAAARRAGLSPELVDLSAFAMIRALYVPETRHHAMDTGPDLARPHVEEPQDFEPVEEHSYEEAVPEETHEEPQDYVAPVEEVSYDEPAADESYDEPYEEPRYDVSIDTPVEEPVHDEPVVEEAAFASAYEKPVAEQTYEDEPEVFGTGGYDLDSVTIGDDEHASHDEPAAYEEPASFTEEPESFEESASYDFGDPTAERAPEPVEPVESVEPVEEPSADADVPPAWDDTTASSESLGTIYCYVGGMTNLAIAVGRTCFFNRVLQNGLESLAATLAERRGLTLDHAREWLRHVGLERDLDRIEGEREIIEEAREVLESGARRIADEVRLSIEYYHSTVPNAPRVESAVLAGPGIAIAGLAGLLEQELGVPVESRSMGKIEVRPGALDSVDGAHLTVATGLALDEVPA
jgi:Tfp pilus assembly PilM family ATPase